MGLSSCLVFLLLFLQNNGVLGCYTSIFSFGDSYADTGNWNFCDRDYPCKHFPYGQTFFHSPTGRCSNGRLVIDFLAQALALPFIPPYLGHKNEDFVQGVNLAVAGATALDVAFFDEKGVHISTNYSLGIQLGWFKQLLPSLCPWTTDCQNMLRNSLFVVGEIGGNDYTNPFIQGNPTQEIRAIAPNVIDVISSTISALIDEGAVTLVVPGLIPLGCLPLYLTRFHSKNNDDYDPSTGCLKRFNEFTLFHNDLLQKELKRLTELHPHATILYADYYNVSMKFYRFPNQFGFKKGALTACCGGGGLYNYNLSAKCGYVGSNACDDSSSYVSWDGVHLTEAAYKWITNQLLNGPFSIPRINVSCVSSKPHNVDPSSFYS